MSEEVRKILKLLSEGKITVEEAEKLISYVKEETDDERRTSKRLVKIYVEKGGNQITSLTVPVKLLDLFLGISSKSTKAINIGGEEISLDLEALRKALKDTEFCGRIVDVESQEEGVRVKMEVI